MKLMTYVWDERKRSANLEKHGLDFVDANLVHEAPVKVTFDLAVDHCVAELSTEFGVR